MHEIESRNWWAKWSRGIDERNAKSSREIDERNRVAKLMSKVELRNWWAKLNRKIDARNRVAKLMKEIESLAKLVSEIESRDWWAKSSREIDGWWAKSSREIDERNRVARLVSEIESREWWVVDSNARVRSPSQIRQWTAVWVIAVGGGVEALLSSTEAGARAHTMMEWVCVWLGVGIVGLVGGFRWMTRSWLTLLSASSTSVSTR
jgi:hypothetical protein